MKLSVNLPDVDVEFLGAYARTDGYPSRSAVLHQAVRLLRDAELEGAYRDAWSGAITVDEHLWDVTVGNGISASL
jgi:Arc/MetJ-type ribon-helix-helix transcriptional regulator